MTHRWEKESDKTMINGIKLFDTHSHYTDSRFDSEYPGGATALLTEVFNSEVEFIVNCSCDVENSKKVIEMSANYNGMYASIGIHPESCISLSALNEDLSVLSSLLDRKKELKIKAIGEIGLDYHWSADSKELQKHYLEEQLKLAEQYNMPVIIHDREAHGDCFEAVLKHPKVKGVFHSYSGSPEMALELTRRGWYISFSGVVSFKNAKKTVETAAIIPPDRLLIETDCPYLAPVPFRGKLNRSDYLKYTLEAIAKAREIDEFTLSEQIFSNSLNFFNI